MAAEKLLTEIGNQVNHECLSRKCSGDSCRVYLTGVPTPRVIVDLECEFEQRKINRKRCDYVIFYINVHQSSLDIILIELKSGTFKTPAIVDQLQNGVDFVNVMLEKLREMPNTSLDAFEIKCIPVLFHGKGIARCLTLHWTLLRLNVSLYYFMVKALTDFNSYNLNVLKYVSKTETLGLGEVNVEKQRISL